MNYENLFVNLRFRNKPIIMKKITYFGCLVTLMLTQIPYGGAIIIGNIIIYALIILYLIGLRKSQPFKLGYMDEINPAVLIIVSILGIGTIHGIHLLYKFYKYPIKVGMTKIGRAHV